MGLVDRSASTDSSESSGEATEASEDGSDEDGEEGEQSAGPLARARTVCTEAAGVVVDAVLDAL